MYYIFKFNISKILSFRHVVKIKLLMRFFCTKSLKSRVCFNLTAHLSLDWPQSRCPVAALGQSLLRWTAQGEHSYEVNPLMVWLQLPSGGRKGSCEMSAHVQETKCWFLRRKMLTGLSGKYDLISELFICTSRILLYSSVDFIFMEKNTPH